MPSKHTKRSYTAVPKRLLRFRPLMWAALGCLGAGLVAMGWGVILSNTTVSTHHNYVGELSPDADPITITVPKGAILQETLASRNEEIVSGQTVAVLNVPAMEETVATLSGQVLADVILRDCLLVEELPDTPQIDGLSEATQNHVRIAYQTCAEFLGEKTRRQEKLEHDGALLSTELDLVEQYLKVLSLSADLNLSATKKQDDARQGLALALLGNKIEKQLSELKFDADKEHAEWQHERLTRIQELSASIQSKTSLRQKMQLLVDKPRLQAPINGVISRVRRVPHNVPIHEDIDFVEVRSEEGTGYQASFIVPHNRLDAVAPGQTVRMTMLGMLDGGPELVGKVSALNTVGGTTVRAQVELDKASVSRLDNPQIGIALRGLGTASIVQVEKPGFAVLPAIQETLAQSIFLRKEDWFLSKLSPSG